MASAGTSAGRACASWSWRWSHTREPRLAAGFIALGLDKVLAQAIAVVLVTPLNFVGNKLWSFRSRP